MSHTILLVQANENPNSRTYAYYDSVDQCMEGVCKIYKKHMKLRNPRTYRTPTISQLFVFVDTLTDLNCFVYQNSTYIRYKKESIKNFLGSYYVKSLERERTNRDTSYKRKSMGMKHQSVLEEYARKCIDELTIAATAAKLCYRNSGILQNLFPNFDRKYEEFDTRVFWDSLKNELFCGNLRESRVYIFDWLDYLTHKVDGLVEIIVQGADVPIIGQQNLLRRIYQIKFNAIRDKHENIAITSSEYENEINGEKTYYEYLRKIYTGEIDDLLQSVNDVNSFKDLWSKIKEYAEKLTDIIEKIQRLAKGIKVEDSLILSGDDDLIDDDLIDDDLSDDDLTTEV